MTENEIAADFGMRMQEEFLKKNGRVLPKDDVEFGGMLGIAFMLGRESMAETHSIPPVRGFACKCGVRILYGRKHLNCPADKAQEGA